jgi:hypothetical protein
MNKLWNVMGCGDPNCDLCNRSFVGPAARRKAEAEAAELERLRARARGDNPEDVPPGLALTIAVVTLTVCGLLLRGLM